MHGYRHMSLSAYTYVLSRIVSIMGGHTNGNNEFAGYAILIAVSVTHTCPHKAGWASAADSGAVLARGRRLSGARFPLEPSRLPDLVANPRCREWYPSQVTAIEVWE